MRALPPVGTIRRSGASNHIQTPCPDPISNWRKETPDPPIIFGGHLKQAHILDREWLEPADFNSHRIRLAVKKSAAHKRGAALRRPVRRKLAKAKDASHPQASNGERPRLSFVASRATRQAGHAHHPPPAPHRRKALPRASASFIGLTRRCGSQRGPGSGRQRCPGPVAAGRPSDVRWSCWPAAPAPGFPPAAPRRGRACVAGP